MKREHKKYYLKCEVSEGMFSTERGISFKDIEGKEISGFWPDSFIKGNRLEIQLIESGKDKSLICGPFPDCGGYGFFQGSCFYVDNNLISDSYQIVPAIAPVNHQEPNSKTL